MFKYIALAVVVLIAGVLIYATTFPDTFRVERKTTIKAPPEKVLALVNDFHQWGAWSPWEKMDPAMKRDYSGPASGVGAAYAWDGSSKVGQGRMEILQAEPTKTTIKLDFIKPIEGHNIAEFSTVTAGDSTTLTWSMDGPRPYISKLIGVFMNMDQLIGSDFEKGLADLKSVAEK